MKKIGVPNLNRPGEKRAFSPEFISELSLLAPIVLENYYGFKMGYNHKEYLQIPNISFSSREQVFTSDLVFSLIAPDETDLESMVNGQTLVTMAHFPTRPKRNELLMRLGVQTISLDGISNEQGIRLVQDLKGTAYNGVNAGLIEFEKNLSEYGWSNDTTFNVVLLGYGGVGKFAELAIRENYKNIFSHLALPVPELKLHILRSKEVMNGKLDEIFSSENIHFLVDATARHDSSKPIVLPYHISQMYTHAVLLDLAADPRKKDIIAPGIHGIPIGNALKYVFKADDFGWEKDIPREMQLPKNVRRKITAVSHNAWPSYGNIDDLKKNMNTYANQIYPILELLCTRHETNPELSKSIENASLKSFMTLCSN